MRSTVLLYANARHYQGKLTPATWDQAKGLVDLGADVLLLLSIGSVACVQLENTLSAFLQNRPLSYFVLLVRMDQQPLAARQLSASIVPQLRVFSKGEEVGRHHGSALYEDISRLLGMVV